MQTYILILKYHCLTNKNFNPTATMNDMKHVQNLSYLVTFVRPGWAMYNATQEK
jgi:hypothetical protein